MSVNAGDKRGGKVMADCGSGVVYDQLSIQK